MSRIFDQIRQTPGIGYNRAYSDEKAIQKEKNRAWEWWEELQEQSAGFQALEAAKGKECSDYLEFAVKSNPNVKH